MAQLLLTMIDVVAVGLLVLGLMSRDTAGNLAVACLGVHPAMGAGR